MQQAFKERGNGRGKKHEIGYLRAKLWPCIEREMNRCLLLHRMHCNSEHQTGESIRLPITTFNQFLNFVNDFEVDAENGSSVQLVDEYYLLAKQVGIHPNLVTFNILLRANRICQGSIRGKLVSVYLNDMIDYGIQADSYTIVELLSMCARCPSSKTMNGTMTNKQVADAEFEYYLKNIYPVETANFKVHKTRKLSPSVVLNEYLHVYSNDGDVEGMRQILVLAKKYKININTIRAARRNCKKFGFRYNHLGLGDFKQKD